MTATAITRFLTPLVDPLCSVEETQDAEWKGVDRTYSDPTDGYPALNSIPGAFATKVSCSRMKSFPDVYSTAEYLEIHTDGSVVVGAQHAMAYQEVRAYSDWASQQTCEVGTKGGAVSNLVIFALLPLRAVGQPDTTSTTSANFGPGGQKPTIHVADKTCQVKVSSEQVGNMVVATEADGGANVKIAQVAKDVGVIPSAVGSVAPGVEDWVVVTVLP